MCACMIARLRACVYTQVEMVGGWTGVFFFLICELCNICTVIVSIIVSMNIIVMQCLQPSFSVP